MTQEAQAIAQVDPTLSRPKADLLGVAFLATLAVVMTIWIGALGWAAISVLNWIVG